MRSTDTHPRHGVGHHTADTTTAPRRTGPQEHSTDDPALRVSDLCLEYPDGTDEQGRARTVRALDRVCLELAAGTMTALVGPSGSGKSSLLAVAAGLVRPSSGSVSVAGRRIEALPERELAGIRREHTGIVFQQPNLLASLTSREQLVLSAHVGGARGKELARARTRADELLAQVGLESCADRRPHQLSGGQRQRVNIARALMNEPRLLLVDEPTAALDQARSRSVMELLAHLTHSFGLASLVVTHDTEFVPLADACVSMQDGRLDTDRVTTALGATDPIVV